MKLFKKLALAAALAGAVFGAQAGVVIDDFSVGQTSIRDDVTDANPNWSVATGASILGGVRELYVQKLNAAADDPYAGGSIGVFSGKLNFATDAGQTAIAGILWDGNATAGNQDALSENLIASGSSFQFVVPSADLAFPFVIAVSSNGGANTSYFAATSAGAGTYNIPFGWFVGTADFSNVSSIAAYINFNPLLGGPFAGATEAVDLRLDMAQVVPEPGTLALAGLSLVGLAGLRRRQKA